jgi:hypothetical protein
MRRVSLFCLAFALFAVTAMAQYEPKGIQGGIGYARNGHVFWYDFPTQKETDLSLVNEYLKDVVIKPPVAFSANGEVMAYCDGPEVYVVLLPKGKPYAIEYHCKKQIHGGHETTANFELTPSIVRNVTALRLSPNGARLAIEGLFHKIGWYEQLPGNPPTYALKDDVFWGIYYESTISNTSFSREQDSIYYGEQIYRPMFGHVSDRPPVPFYRASSQDTTTWWAMHGGAPSVSGWVGIQPGDPNNSLNYKVSARFLTFPTPEVWESGKRLVCIMLQKGGPIEIRLLEGDINLADNLEGGYGPGSSHLYNNADNVDVVRRWKIMVNFPSCEGMARKPDGSITVLSIGTLYMIDHYEIEKCIAGSSVAVRAGHGAAVYANNTFTPSLVKLAEGLAGATCIQWDSNESFVFLDKDKALCRWKKGVVEKINYVVAGNEFCYCFTSPLNTPAAIGHGTSKARICETYNYEKGLMSLRVGYIVTSLNEFGVFVGKVGHQNVEFCKTDKTSFDDVDLSSCQWQKIKDGMESVYAMPGKVLALRNGRDCAMIIPNGFEPRWKSWSEVPEMIKKVNADHIDLTRPPPYNGWMHYDWISKTLDSEEFTPAKAVVKEKPHKARGERKVASSDSSDKPKNKRSQLLELNEKSDFTIGAVKKFHWYRHDGNEASISIPINEDKMGVCQWVFIPNEHLENIEDPSEYFKSPFPGKGTLPRSVSGVNFPCKPGTVCLVRYEGLEDKFFGVEFVEKRPGKTVYKKGVWPDNEPGDIRVASRPGETR